MNDNPNPYRSPQSPPEKPPMLSPVEVSVRRGRVIYLGIVAVLLFLALGLPLLLGTEPGWIRIAVMMGLLIGGWRGQGLSITLLAFGLVVGLISAFVTTLSAISLALLGALALTLAVGLAEAGILLALVFSESLNAFFRHQEQQRSAAGLAAAMAHHRREVVALTPEGAELARKIMGDQSYPPETALRIVPRDDGSTDVDILYDLPSDGDCDWVSESSGVVVLVRKTDADRLEGLSIDAQGGQYVFAWRCNPVRIMVE